MAVATQLQELRRFMADQSQSQQATFADLKSAINQIANDAVSQSNTISTQLKDVQQMIETTASKSASGQTPSPAEFQSMISQLAAVHSLITQSSASIQASATQMSQMQPPPPPSSSGSEPPPPPSSSTPPPPPDPASTSLSGNAGASSVSGGSLEPGTGSPTQSGASPYSTLGEGDNTMPTGLDHGSTTSSSGVGEGPGTLIDTKV